MPYLRIGDKLHPIPWDADKVAELIFRGFEVQPDDGIDEATYKLHQEQLDQRLRKMWGDNKLRALVPQGTRNAAPHTPAIVAGEDALQSYRGGMLRDVAPNPYIEFQRRAIDQQDMINLQNLLNFKGNIKKAIDV